MRVACLCLVIALFVPLPGWADIVPLPPQPPPPAGPDAAVIRGVGVTRAYAYWRGRRWLTSIENCPPTQAACRDGRLLESRCYVVGADDRAIAGGDIAALVSAEKAATNRPIRIRLEGCGGLTQIELQR